MRYFLAILMAALAAGCASTKMTHGIPNFAVVKPGVYRGGQPKTKADWQYLKSLGVYNVIKLNLESEGSDEEAWNEGMVVYYVPVNIWQQLGFEKMPPNFSLGWQSNIGGTFIHCEHGEDRTGEFIAIQRVKFEGWSKADAEAEMLAHGFHKSLHGLWEYWEDEVP